MLGVFCSSDHHPEGRGWVIDLEFIGVSLSGFLNLTNAFVFVFQLRDSCPFNDFLHLGKREALGGEVAKDYVSCDSIRY